MLFHSIPLQRSPGRHEAGTCARVHAPFAAKPFKKNEKNMEERTHTISYQPSDVCSNIITLLIAHFSESLARGHKTQNSLQKIVSVEQDKTAVPVRKETLLPRAAVDHPVSLANQTVPGTCAYRAYAVRCARVVQ